MTIPAAMTEYTPLCSGRARISNCLRRRPARPRPIEREGVRVDSSITDIRDQAVEGEAGEPHLFHFVARRTPAGGGSTPAARRHEEAPPRPQRGRNTAPPTSHTLPR